MIHLNYVDCLGETEDDKLTCYQDKAWAYVYATYILYVILTGGHHLFSLQRCLISYLHIYWIWPCHCKGWVGEALSCTCSIAVAPHESVSYSFVTKADSAIQKHTHNSPCQIQVSLQRCQLSTSSFNLRLECSAKSPDLLLLCIIECSQTNSTINT